MKKPLLCVLVVPLLMQTFRIHAGPSAELPPHFVNVETIATAGNPNGIARYGDHVLFAAVSHAQAAAGDSSAASAGGQAEIQIFKKTDGLYRRVGSVPLKSANGSSQGLTLTPDQSTLLVPVDGYGVAFVDVQDALAGTAQPTYVLQNDNGLQTNGAGSFETAVTPDGKYAFVANEYGQLPTETVEGNVGVMRLGKDANGKTQGVVLGYIPLAGGIVPDVSVSHDGKRVYASSEIVPADRVSELAGAMNPNLVSNRCVQDDPSKPQPNGAVSIIDVAAATDPANVSSNGIISHAVVRNVAAACSPVRATETAHGDALWVAARGSDELLQFDLHRLLSPGKDPSGGLKQAVASGGQAPVAVELFDKDGTGEYRYLMVSNSNRFGSQAGDPDSDEVNVTVFDISAEKASVIQTIPTGFFPRDILVPRRGEHAFISDYHSNNILRLEQINEPFSAGASSD